jgi:hypothetical protein
METRRWINQGQPQTLQIAVFLLYFQALFVLLLGSNTDNLVLAALLKVGIGYSGFLESLVTLIVGFGAAGAAFLIANEQKWGYRLGVGIAALPVAAMLILLVLPTMNNVPRVSLEDLGLLSVMVDVALFALLVHPQSRDYERIWFK